MNEQGKSTERYYWLKMERKFMDRHDMKIIKSIGGPDKGARLALIYISLLLESIDHQGDLRFNKDKPYTTTMLAAVTGEEKETMKDAMQIFKDLGLIEIREDGTIHMTKLKGMVGSETAWAKKKREYRANQDTGKIEENEEKQEEKGGHYPDNKDTSSNKSKRQNKNKNKNHLQKENIKEKVEEEAGPGSDEWAAKMKANKPWT